MSTLAERRLLQNKGRKITWLHLPISILNMMSSFSSKCDRKLTDEKWWKKMSLRNKEECGKINKRPLSSTKRNVDIKESYMGYCLLFYNFTWKLRAEWPQWALKTYPRVTQNLLCSQSLEFVEILLPRAGIIDLSFHAPPFIRQVYEQSMKRSCQNMTASTLCIRTENLWGNEYLERNL